MKRSPGPSADAYKASPAWFRSSVKHRNPLYRTLGVCQPALAVLFCLILAGTGCGADKEARRNQAQASMQMAYVHLREERPAKALQELTKAEALDPENPETKNWLGLAFWARQDPARAEVKFKEATALKPDYSEAWNNMGALYIELKRYDDAVTVLTRALSNELYSKHDTALTNLGWALLQLGRKDEARAKLEEAVEANPRSPLAQRNLGIAYQELGDHARALEQFEKTIKIYPDDAETHLRKGISLLKTAKKDEARAAFEQAWRLAPTTNTGKSAKNYLDIMQ